MNNLILFINSFLSYLLVVAVIVCVAALALFIGIKMRLKKNAEEEAAAGSVTEEINENS